MAVPGPAFVTVSVYVRLLPVATGSGESAIDTPRSAGLLTSVFSLAELFVEFGSVCAPVTLAEFVIVPGVDGAVTAMSTLASR